jgi:hypothetical protein
MISMKELRNMCTGNLKGTGHFGDVVVVGWGGGNVRVVREMGLKVLTGFKCLRVSFVGRM